MIEFIHNTWWLEHVSDLNGPSSGAFTSCMLQIWYVVICVLFDTFRCYAVVLQPTFTEEHVKMIRPLVRNDGVAKEMEAVISSKPLSPNCASHPITYSNL